MMSMLSRAGRVFSEGEITRTRAINAENQERASIETYRLDAMEMPLLVNDHH